MSTGSFSQAGFYYQNNLAALKVIELLEIDSQILKIQLENFQKGPHIDDIIITGKKLTEFIQVKWSSDSNAAFTIHNLAYQIAEGEKDSLWRKLAKGYQNKTNVGGSSQITLFSTRAAGSSRLQSKGIDKSLSELIKFQKRYISGNLPLDQVPEYGDFEQVLKMLRTESKLSEQEFSDFIKILNFELSAPDKDHIQLQLHSRTEQLGLDATHVDRLLDLVVNWSISGEDITKHSLLEGLGIGSRFVDRLSHVFKIEESIYVENSALFEKLDHAIAQYKSGHIFVEGVPGAGKSTALTKYLSRNKSVRFAYYCFIPDDKLTADNRLNGDYFLKSLCITIETGFPELDLPIRYSADYREKFGLYIEKLAEQDEKIIILIDGIDHVDRNKAFINNPLTSSILSQVPDNIYFIISSQYIDALPLTVRAIISSESGRHIRIDRFDQAKIRDYLQKRGLSIDDEQISQLHEKSEGIPLYLYYISAFLEQTDPLEISGAIGNFPALLNGEINTYHTQLYQQIKDDPTMVWALALLANRKEFTSIDVLQQILSAAGNHSDLAELTTKIAKFSHLLKDKEGKYYNIFHNSFREFIITKTLHLTEKLNQALISYYENDIFGEEAFRNYFSHLLVLEKYQELVSKVNDLWINDAWGRYHSPADILENINTAWIASLKLGSISEFVRIAFLKYQVNVFEWYLENNGFEDSMYFLEAGLTKESFRTIWNGEFSMLENAGFFNYYAVKYLEKTGILIPKNVAIQFFSTFLSQNNLENEQTKADKPRLANYLMAKSLYSNPEELLEELRKLNQYLTQVELKELLKFLGRKNKLLHLICLLDAVKSPLLKAFTRAELIIALHRKKSKDVAIYQKDFSISQLKPLEKIDFLIRLLGKLRAQNVKEDFPKLKASPVISIKLIQKGYPSKLEPEFLILFDKLKIHYLYGEKNYTSFSKKIAAIGGYSGKLHKAISDAAKIWTDHNMGIGIPNLLPELKKIIELLVLSPYDVQYVIGGYRDDSSLKYELHTLHKKIFPLFSEVCNIEELKELADHWLETHAQAGFKDFQSNLYLVDAVKHDDGLKDTSRKLLTQAEELARADETTSSLVQSLTAVGLKFGATGFSEDYNRIYMELPSLACGVSYRKDYQFANIFTLLPEIHKTDPEGSLTRIADLYYLLYKIKDAGNPRMFHICLATLIKYVAKIYPGLALEIALKDDMYMDRDEAMGIYIEQLIDGANEKSLDFVWAIIKTMGRWEGFGSASDNHLTDIYEYFAKKLAQIGNPIFNEKVYRQMFWEFDTEQKMPEKIYRINAIFETRDNYPFLLYPPINKEENPKPANHFGEKAKKREKFLLPQTKLNLEQLKKLADSGIENIEAYIKTYVATVEFNKVTPIWSQVYSGVMTEIKPWFNTLQLPEQNILLSKHFALKRSFLGRKSQYGSMLTKNKASLKELLLKPLKELQNLLPTKNAAEELTRADWLDKILNQAYIGTKRYTSRLYAAISDEDVAELTRLATYNQIEKWTSLLFEFFDRKIIIGCLVNLSKIAHVYDEDQAREILDVAFQTLENINHGSTDIAKELLDWSYICYPAKANAFVLQSFYSGHQRSYSEIPYDIDRVLVPYQENFNDPGFYAAYYTANYQYNLKLAEGLSEPAVELAFINTYKESGSFENMAINYIIDLFDYPVVKIRQLAIEALYELYQAYPSIVENTILEKSRSASTNQKEHIISLFSSLAVILPAKVAKILDQYSYLLDSGHFNIENSFADLIRFLADQNQNINLDLLEKASLINTSAINQANLKDDTGKTGLRLYSMYPYQEYLISEIEYRQNRNIGFSRMLNTILLAKGYKKTDVLEFERKVHQNYNKNSNWDSVEINGPAYQLIQEQLNQLFSQKIREGNFDQEAIEELKYKFRIYDPSDQQISPQKQLSSIRWNDMTTIEEEFLEFKDVDKLVTDFISRYPDKITLFEKGFHRVESYPSHFTTYFEICLFLTEPGIEQEQLWELFREYTPYLHSDNLYRHEIEQYFSDYGSDTTIADIISPLIAMSERDFRLRDEGAIAIVLPAITQQMKFQRNQNSLCYSNSGNVETISFLEWQGEFKDMDRRRFEPVSKGCSLMINRTTLTEYIKGIDKSLYMRINLRRTTDKYKPQNEMNWRTSSFLRKIKLQSQNE
ncbi:NACHT domain-containing protein [Pedobacter polysacchareus]|uniref:NACHT domain-containing protein n=1 Tax=Pedobacter polysacchareus TaxID=2861973 RepID=UPI001C99E20E|nr:dsDNA nuclease domain-containing protein [Pedobacter polysacchareus]